MFHHMVKNIGIDLETASALFSANPAKIIHVENITGSIGCDLQADLVMLDKKYDLVNTISKGRIIY